MKLKSFLLSFAIIACTLLSNGQTLKWGVMEKSANNGKPYEIIGYDSKGVYITKYSPLKTTFVNKTYQPIVTFEKYDFPNMNKEFSEVLYITEDGTDKGKEMYYDGLFYLKNKMLMIIYSNDSKALYGMNVNADGSVDNNKVQLGTVEVTAWRRATLADYRYTFSATKDKSGITGACINNIKEDKLTLKAIDENIKELWTKEIENPFKETKMSYIINVHSVDNGVAYVLVSLGKDIHDPTGYGLIVYDQKADKVSAFKIDLGGDMFPNLIGFNVDNSGNAAISGFYGDVKSKVTEIGTFNIRADRTGQVTVKNTTPFDKDFLAHIIGDGDIKKGRGIDKLGMKNLVMRDDGSVIIAAEQCNANKGLEKELPVLTAPHNEGAEPNQNLAEGDYYDVIVAKINADGTTAWVKSVPKKQGCQDIWIAHSVCSYTMIVGAKNVYIVYNDSKKNSEKKAQGVIDGDNSDLNFNVIDATAGIHPLNMCETIDIASGSVKREAISPENSDKLRLWSGMTINYGSDKAILYKSDNGKNDQLGFITIE